MGDLIEKFLPEARSTTPPPGCTLTQKIHSIPQLSSIKRRVESEVDICSYPKSLETLALGHYSVFVMCLLLETIGKRAAGISRGEGLILREMKVGRPQRGRFCFGNDVPRFSPASPQLLSVVLCRMLRRISL